MSIGAPTTASRNREAWAIRGLIRRHWVATLGVAAVLAFMVAMFVVAVLNGPAGAVSDSSSCSQWGNANQNQQAAYAKLYLREHGSLSGGRSSPASVITAINDGCTEAYGEDVSDTTSVVQAIKGDF